MVCAAFPGGIHPKEDYLQATAGPLQKGQTVLVTAAGGATGHMGAQLALLAGCTVVATCGSDSKAQRLRALGIHRVINHREEVVVNGHLLFLGRPGKYITVSSCQECKTHMAGI